MDTSNSLQLPEVMVETFRLHIEEFLTKLTVEQWNLLKAETPDNNTKFLLAELLMNLASSVSSELIKKHGNTVLPLSPERVQASLGDALRQGLVPGNLEKSESLDQLTDFVADEMTERVNSRLSDCPARPPSFQVAPSNKLEKMIFCVCELLKTADVGDIFRPKLFSPKTIDIIELPAAASDNAPESEPRVSSKDYSVATAPLVDEMFQSDLNEVIAESFPEFKSIAEEISRKVSEDTKTPETRCLKTSKCNRAFWKGVGKKIKKFMAKLFATISMLKIGAQIRKDYEQETKVHSRESVKPLMSSVESVLLTEQTEQNNSPEIIEALKKELTVVLYNFVTDSNLQLTADIEMENAVPESHRKMLKDIQEKVFSFLLLVGLFLIQVRENPNRVQSVLTDIESIADPSLSHFHGVKDLEESRKKLYFNLLIDLLVTRVYVKAKVDQCCGEAKHLTQNLFDKTWAAVRDFDVDFKITPEIIEYLQKPVFKDLCKKWTCPEMLLVSICKKEPEVEKSIAASMKKHMYKKSGPFFKWQK